jgi:NADP-dependent 3-hydroxy acid dehydrogenase YdfG
MRIVITGATSGIGAALALHYARPGTSLGLLGRRQGRLADVATRCEAQGASILAGPIDVCDGSAMRAYASAFLEQADGVDLVIANAGVSGPDDLGSGDPSSHARMFDVNVNGVLNTLLPFIPAMQRQQHGHLVAIASIAGFRALPSATTYAATKMAVRTLMEGYGWSLHADGIVVTTINPGYVVSELTAQNTFEMPFLLPTEEAARKIARAIQKKRRVYTFPWQMAIIAYLLPYIPGVLMRRAAPGRDRRRASS